MKTFKHKSVQPLTAPFGECIPKWDEKRMEKRLCIVCKEAKYTIIACRPDGLYVGKCDNCSAIYLPIVPNKLQLKEFYETYSATKPYMQQKSSVRKQTIFLKSYCLLANTLRYSKFSVRLRNSIMRSRPVFISETCELLMRTGGLEGKMVLEIGPGKSGGILPEIAFWGGNGLAVEVDPIAAQSISKLGLSVFSDISMIHQSVDIIYASMVLEHLIDPADFLTRLAHISIPGGRILVRVPNAGQAASFGENWIGFRVDLEHLNYFDQRSLNTILFKAGFQIECVWLTSQPILPEYLPMADRNRFIEYAKIKAGRQIRCANDPLSNPGEFMLTALARNDSK